MNDLENITTKVLISTTSRDLADKLLAEKFTKAHQFELVSKARESAASVHITMEITGSEAVRPIAVWFYNNVHQHGAASTKIEGRSCPDNESGIEELFNEIITATEQESLNSET
jgi:hypothetical protein